MYYFLSQIIYECVCVCVCVIFHLTVCCWLLVPVKRSPTERAELILTNLWGGLRPLTHNKPGKQGHNSWTGTRYLLTAR